MLCNVERLFDDMAEMLKKLKKSSYETNMEQFREKNRDFFTGLFEWIEQTDDKEQAASEIGVNFAEEVHKFFAVKGRIKGRVQADLNFFMIYYTFPALLLVKHPQSETVAAAICREWGQRFPDSKIGYADYDKIHDAFREKIFGIF